MKKTLLILFVLMFLFISVSSVSAKRYLCRPIEGPVRIHSIEPDDRKILVPYLVCVDPGGGGELRTVWLFVTDTTKIRFSGEGWDATFDDLSTEDQRIDYTFQMIDVFDLLGTAKTITIYPD